MPCRRFWRNLAQSGGIRGGAVLSGGTGRPLHPFPERKNARGLVRRGVWYGLPSGNCFLIKSNPLRR